MKEVKKKIILNVLPVFLPVIIIGLYYAYFFYSFGLSRPWFLWSFSLIIPFHYYCLLMTSICWFGFLFLNSCWKIDSFYNLIRNMPLFFPYLLIGSRAMGRQWGGSRPCRTWRLNSVNVLICFIYSDLLEFSHLKDSWSSHWS